MRIIKSTLLFLFIVSCSNNLPKSPEPQLHIKVSAIVNSITNRPVKGNIVRLSWIDPDGLVIQSEEYKNRESFVVLVPADGFTKLLIIVDAPGFHQWSQEIRAKQNSSKMYELIIQMDPSEDVQG